MKINNSILTKATLFLTMTLSLSNCKHETSIEHTIEQSLQLSESGEDYIPDISDCFTNVELVNGILRFSSNDAFQSTIECLSTNSNIMDSLFLIDWGNLSDSLLNLKMEEIGYNEDLVYIAFENYYSHASLRHHMEDLMDSWAEDLPLDTNNIPNHVVGDKEFQTVLSIDGAFMLVDTIYFVSSDGLYYRILNGDFDVLDSLLNKTWFGPNHNVEINYTDGTSSRSNACKSTKDSNKQWVYSSNSNYGLCMKSGFYNIWPKCTWYADSESKKRDGGKYKSYKTSELGVGMSGSRYNKNAQGDCGNLTENYALPKTKYHKSNVHITRTAWQEAGRWYSYGHVGGHSSDKVGNGTAHYTSPHW